MVLWGYMPVAIAFIVVALVVSLWGGLLNPEKETPSMQASVSQVSQNKTLKEAETEKEESQVPEFSVDTYIKYGPGNKEVIEDTNKIIFEFGATISPAETEGKVYFETKVEGLDEDWKKTSSSKRTITLPPGPNEYTFLVRAKVKDVVDPTPAKRTFQLEISPYFGKVTISKVEAETYPYPFSIKLKTDLEKEEKINITGWEFEGEYGSFLIPQGIEEFNPTISPQISKDIIIERGDTIYISSEPSPLGSKTGNFRPNKCMGYLKSSHNFTISISKNCPKITKTNLPYYLEDCCKEYILSLKTCERPDYQGMKEYNLFEDDNCMSYMNYNLTYGGCFRNYYQDENFTDDEWHIYLDLNGKKIFDEKRDIVYLRDKNGLLIDEYTYGKFSCKECY